MYGRDLSLHSQTAAVADAMLHHDQASSVAEGRPSAASLHEWHQVLQTACQAIPLGQLHRHLTAPWLERQLSMHPAPSALRHLTDESRQALKSCCDRAAMGLQLHAGFRVHGQAAAISAALMLGMNRVLGLDLDSPLMTSLADRIHAEFHRPGPDWSRITLKEVPSEPRLAMALTRSRNASEKPPVRFTVDLLQQRSCAPGPDQQRRPEGRPPRV